MYLFGRARKATVDPRSNVESIRSTIDLIEKREEHFRIRIKKETCQAQTLASSDKQRALVCLKRRKLYQSELDRMTQTRTNLEIQLMAIENATFNLETLSVMKTTKATLTNLNKTIGTDAEDVMDDVRDQIDIAEESADVLSRPLILIDDDEFLDEIESWEQAEITKNLLAPAEAIVPSMPKVPISDEDEIRELRATMLL